MLAVVNVLAIVTGGCHCPTSALALITVLALVTGAALRKCLWRAESERISKCKTATGSLSTLRMNSRMAEAKERQRSRESEAKALPTSPEM